ncbi:E3 ubiquitin-protein ligase HECTD3-like isoform X2 [Protopterus annectens]|uniref:E3 ubiquitin-protein ligase HECTD3-like isoform X2 n=1 Tax=Protopterus annectens TaxID=7888 RepID=UPI001CFB5398|nr:E3 ubiquitin-protein ligase HECTD3-like isoform X2 [Protopterus annectens]
METMTPADSPHLLLGRVRFLLECIECFRETKPLPESLCYVPKDVYYKICKDSPSTTISTVKSIIPVWESPCQSKDIKKLFRFNIEVEKGTCIHATGEEYLNSYGLWVKMNKEQLEKYKSGCDLEEGWILLCKHTEGCNRLVLYESSERLQNQQLVYGYDYKPVNRWEQVVDAKHMCTIGLKIKSAEMDKVAVERMRYVPPTWNYDCDEQLVHCVAASTNDEELGNVKQYVDKIEVSSHMDESYSMNLTDGSTLTCWQSSSGEKPHWIRLHMKRGVSIKKLNLIVQPSDDSYLPKTIAVYWKQHNDMKKLNEIDVEDFSSTEICVLEDATNFMNVIEIHILECKDGGRDVQIRGISITSLSSSLGLNADVFQSANLIRYPRLEGVDTDVLYRRAAAIQRFVTVLDNLITHLVPTWNYSVGTFLQLKYIKQLLMLSKCRSTLMSECLKESETQHPSSSPTVTINRRLAMEHRENVSLDPSSKNTVFCQIYDGLKYSKTCRKPLDYRWSSEYTQWWECKFVSEGMSDHGGGFRESISAISEELCPSSMDSPVPLPYFVRTSNQGNNTGEGRDMYVPNPSCKDFARYEWIGQLMGATFRGKEFLVLSLPPIVWKQLSGEAVSWSRDFPAVDSMLVKLLEALEAMDKEAFEFQFGNELTYTTMLSDQKEVELIPGGSHIPVKYEDRKEFIQLVQKARLQESKKQIAAIQAGLLKVVPHIVLTLLTWQELEKKICGDPEITIEALKRSIEYAGVEPNEKRVKYLWEALTNFTNEDRSRFLRFVTGRSRLPSSIVICHGRSESEKLDLLPESSTCSTTLYLPDYPSAKVCEEKLRYAVYNCVAIDTDMTPED